jgi:hypothetical protein
MRREDRGFHSVDAAEVFAEDASGTGALQAGKDAATAIRKPPYSH